jgi:hypothetical protein
VRVTVDEVPPPPPLMGLIFAGSMPA